MTIISCEFCGPTRVAPHDIKCPKSENFVRMELTPLTEYIEHAAQRLASLSVPVFTKPPEPLITRNPTHETMPGRFGAVCKCGYDPHETHPEAGRGQLFAYVGYHIREASRA